MTAGPTLLAARPAGTVVTSAAGARAGWAVAWARRDCATLGSPLDAGPIRSAPAGADRARLRGLAAAAGRLRVRFQAGAREAGSSAGAAVPAGPRLLPGAGGAARSGLERLPQPPILPGGDRSTDPWRLAIAPLSATRPCLRLDDRKGAGECRGPGRRG